MNLEDRTNMRRSLQQTMDLPGILKATTPGLRSESDKEARVLINSIDAMNDAEVRKSVRARRGGTN